MKKSFNLETLIIPGFVLIIIAFITLLTLYPTKVESKSNTFVGIDAAGFVHHPDSHIERMEIKFK